MSDTTAYLAGCATTGVAALVLLVARVGMVSASAESSDATSQLDSRISRIEATAPTQQTLSDARTNQRLENDIRRELDKQRDLTKRLEEQLVDQESLSTSLEKQLSEQEDKTKDLMARIQDYQRSVENLELDDKIAAARQTSEPQPSPPAYVIWLGAALAFVLVLGVGGLAICAVLLFMQSQRSRYRGVPMRPPMPMPPASPYQRYDQNFLPPAQLRPQRPSYYDYPPPPYDYNQ